MKKYLDYFPVFTVVLLFYSYNYLVKYYEAFGIDILKYMDASEILASFIPFMLTVSGLCVGFVSLQMFPLFDETGISGRSSTQKKMLSGAPAIICVFLGLGLLKLDSSLAYKISQEIKYSTRFETWYSLQLIGISFLLFTGVIGLIFMLLKLSKDKRLLPAATVVISIGVMLGFARQLQGFYAYRTIGHEKNVKFISNGEKVETVNNLYFLGETNKYIFLLKKNFHNKYERNIAIFQKDKIEELVFTNIIDTSSLRQLIRPGNR